MADTETLSLQLYSLRSLGSVDAVLDAARDAGYRYGEGIGSHLDAAEEVRAKLDARGLKLSSSHVGIAQLRDKPEAIVRACRTLGLSQLYMPSVPPDQRDSPAEYWTSLGRELGELANRFEAEGIALGYHNHNWELRPKAGDRTALDLLFAASEGTKLSWQVDVAWLVRGGADPLALVSRYADRVTSAHVKDIAPAGQNTEEDGWAAVGSGTLDWPALWQACKAAGATWMVVEHDKPADPVANVRASLEYIQTMRG